LLGGYGGSLLILDLMFNKVSKCGSGGQRRKTGSTYSDFEVDKLLRECAHLVIKAESVFSSLARREDEVTLALLFPIHDDLVRRAHNLVIDIKRSSSLYL
jgi:hypothetical protein